MVYDVVALLVADNDDVLEIDREVKDFIVPGSLS